jgi:OOP family OmpA-OmpF porin
MTRLLSERLRQVHGGRLQVSGTRIALQGNVANEALRQQVVSEMAGAQPHLHHRQRPGGGRGGQGVLDKTLSNRVVEFETASARLTPAGSRILDEMAEAIKRIGTPRLQLIGHTDSAGKREANVELSLARANSVRAYLIDKGIPRLRSAPPAPAPTAPGQQRHRRRARPQPAHRVPPQRLTPARRGGPGRAGAGSPAGSSHRPEPQPLPTAGAAGRLSGHH